MNEPTAAVRKLQQMCINLPGENISFRVFFWGAQSNHLDNPLHKHSFYELCYIDSGTALYYENGINYELKKGTFLCSRPGKVHKIHNGKNLSIFWIGFEVNQDTSKIESVNRFKQLAITNNILVHNAESSPTAHLWSALLKHGANLYSQELLCSLSHSFLLSLEILFCGQNVKDEDKSDNSHSNVLISQAQLFISDNLTMPFSLEDVAQHLNISSRHLSRLFSNHVGITFTAYLRRERVRISAEKLRETNLTIKAISDQYQFSSVHYFTRVFSDETSIAPGEYRKLNQ
ncbi:AraC family transcriptional regulator [Salipaludibacillus sp. CF4.18]|uniref:AraC family transcriptional regulator n=1 Tax=Salipaludibacillus sp. CF4.18 TaxID=3373081 RepID=UPI003EE5669D